jgi:hypothetical protein
METDEQKIARLTTKFVELLSKFPAWRATEFLAEEIDYIEEEITLEKLREEAHG